MAAAETTEPALCGGFGLSKVSCQNGHQGRLLPPLLELKIFFFFYLFFSASFLALIASAIATMDAAIATMRADRSEVRPKKACFIVFLDFFQKHFYKKGISIRVDMGVTNKIIGDG
jgi:hypothetical protein